ncbi:MAG: hypothetical protein HYS38_07820 [Acidobacteria bacterium]|nr:hypothetical protein [Acidobacteriota bacterium]
MTDVFSSMKVVCICFGQWGMGINLIGRAELSLEEPSKAIEHRIELDNCFTFEARFPTGAIPHMIDNLEKGTISFGHEVKLTRNDDRPGSWFGPTDLERVNAARHCGVDFKTIVANFGGPAWQEILPYNLQQVIDEKLRLRPAPFDGLAGLARALGLGDLNVEHGASTSFRLQASLPLKFHSVLPNLTNKTLTVTVQAAKSVNPSDVHVSAIRLSDQSPIYLGKIDTWSKSTNGLYNQFQATKELDPFHGSLKLILAFRNWQADVHTQYLSSSDVWTRACEFFDPDLRKTKELISKQGRMDGVIPLEMGALRFLATLGFRTAWFGKEATPRKPDLLAYHETSDGRKFLLLVECTEENPVAKFTKISHEADSMQKFLADEASHVTPVVFIPKKVSQNDHKQAMGHGVALIGLDELELIWKSAKEGSSIERIVQYVEDSAGMEYADGIFRDL